MSWLTQNLSTIIISAILLLLVIWIIVGMVKKKKRGISNCGSGCAGCPMSGNCHKQ